MADNEQVKGRLDEIIIPHAVRSLASMNLIQDITITGTTLKITLASTALDEYSQMWISDKIKESMVGLPDIKDIDIDYVEAKPAELNKIKHVIAVMSGKGGVGKSLISSLAAVALRRKGYEVGILDADITGPSIPKMFGTMERPGGSDSGLLPVTSKSGIEMMSINLLLPSEDEAVIWRGPLIGKAITQFWEEVLWGNLDYLVVDLPPGTADAPLTIMQQLPVAGVIIVFTPQDLTAMIVKKAIKMCQKMDKQILGVVENMSYLYIPELDKRVELFGKSSGDDMAKTADAPLLARFPIDPQLASLCDSGDIERYDSEIMNQFGQSLLEALKAKKLI